MKMVIKGAPDYVWESEWIIFYLDTKWDKDAYIFYTFTDKEHFVELAENEIKENEWLPLVIHNVK